MNNQERKKAEEQAEQGENPDEEEEQNDDDQAEDLKNQELGKFYNMFAEKMIAFDPMDRDIPSDGPNQMMKRDELVDILENKMANKAISGFMLETPMSDDSFDILMNLFD